MELVAAWQLFILLTLTAARRTSPLALSGLAGAWALWSVLTAPPEMQVIQLGTILLILLQDAKPAIWPHIAAQTATPSGAGALRDLSVTGLPHPDRGGAPEPDRSRAAFEAQFAPQRAALRAHLAMAEAGARLQSEKDGPDLRAMLERLKAEWVRGAEAAQATLLPPGPARLTWPADRVWAQDWLRNHLNALTEIRARLDRDHLLMTGLLKICGTGFLIWLEQETDRTRGFLGIAKPAPAIRIIQRRIEIAPNPILTRPATQRPPADLTRAAALRRIAIARVIPHLAHVTPVRNLPAILRDGILPEAGERIATSITFPDDRAFRLARSQTPGEPWVVLILARHILWTEDCLFANPGHPASPDPEALQALFAGPDRPTHLTQCDPSDLRAQVLVAGRIPPDLIETLAFETPEALRAHQSLLAAREAFACGPNSGLFGPAQR